MNLLGKNVVLIMFHKVVFVFSDIFLLFFNLFYIRITVSLVKILFIVISFINQHTRIFFQLSVYVSKFD